MRYPRDNTVRTLQNVTKRSLVDSGKTDTATWGGDTDGRATIEGMLFKINEAVPTIEDFKNGCTIGYNGMFLQLDSTNVMYDEEIGGLVITNGKDALFPYGVIVPRGNRAYEPGTYLLRMEFGPYLFCFTSLTIDGYTGFASEKIEPRYLPDTQFLYAGDGNLLSLDFKGETPASKFAIADMFHSNKKIVICRDVNNDGSYVHYTPVTINNSQTQADLIAIGEDGSTVSFHSIDEF